MALVGPDVDLISSLQQTCGFPIALQGAYVWNCHSKQTPMAEGGHRLQSGLTAVILLNRHGWQVVF